MPGCMITQTQREGPWFALGAYTFARNKLLCERDQLHCFHLKAEDTDKLYPPAFPDEPHSWKKLRAIRWAFDNGYDNVLWVDADILLADDTLLVKEELMPREDEDLSLGWYGNPGEPLDLRAGRVNAGLMAYRPTPWSKKFLEDVEAVQGRYLNNPIWEQAAIVNMLRAGYADHGGRIRLLPHLHRIKGRLGYGIIHPVGKRDPIGKLALMQTMEVTHARHRPR